MLSPIMEGNNDHGDFFLFVDGYLQLSRVKYLIKGSLFCTNGVISDGLMHILFEI